MDRLRVGIVGLRRGQGLVRVLANHPRLEVAALCDLKPTVLADLGPVFGLADRQLYTSFDEFVQAPLDVVVIATPIELHASQSIAALENGKHVLCEQTAAYTLAECDALYRAVRRTGKTYMMAENYCYFHYIRQWRDLVDQGKLGEITYAEGEYIHEIVDLLVDPKTGEKQWRYTRAPIWYCGHTLGPLLTLMDDRIVRATGAQAGRHKYPGESVAFIDMEVGLFQTQKGAVVKILRSQVAPRYHDLIFYSLYGTKGFVETGRAGGWHGTKGRLFLEDEMAKADGAREIDCLTIDPDAPPEARQGGHGTSEYFMVDDFVRAIDTGTKPPIDIARALDFTIPGILAHEAAMAGDTWHDVPLYD